MFRRHLPPQQRAIHAQRRFGLQIFGLVIVPPGPFQNYIWNYSNFCLVYINFLLQLFEDARKSHSGKTILCYLDVWQQDRPMPWWSLRRSPLLPASSLTFCIAPRTSFALPGCFVCWKQEALAFITCESEASYDQCFADKEIASFAMFSFHKMQRALYAHWLSWWLWKHPNICCGCCSICTNSTSKAAWCKISSKKGKQLKQNCSKDPQITHSCAIFL